MALAHRTTGPALLRWLHAGVEGRGHVPGGGGVLLAANHLSFLDHYLLGAASPRPMHFMGKQDLAEGAWGRFNTFFGMIPVDRGKADLVAIRTVAELLGSGRVVGVFPEGTRSPTGELHRFRSGAARMAAAAGAPTVPVALIGTADVWPKGQRPPRRRPAPEVLRIHFGTPIPAPAGDARSRRAYTDALRAAIAAQSGQPVVERYAPIPKDRPDPFG